ncbi:MULTISPECIES: heavy metal response regulator transcription factor [Burkholderiales]|uniref:Heavy metal response regulator transcription factor n=1 Tax=Piscinibacter gummiphilus TaxID=946333 RepID=A0ABZ0D3N6_9BURK|nr:MULTISPECIES: heavy metal response regulator transcription factor [Burkholderiales]MBP6895752.1 heavy metal response regulator transcription factor [Pseudacidovorax sp.]WOB09688.1 heavy metal response regulator transcription factor [Piscinibacter gummiphilus]
MHLLVVEDEEKLGDYLRKGLVESGFNVDLARDGNQGLALAQTGNYDAVVLDIMLPGLDGFKVLQELRKSSPVPVLMLTARDDVEDRVRGLEGGADDYLSKPFAFTELLARVRALLRRSPMQDATRYALADLQLDLTTRRATRSGKRLDLTAKEFALLSLLLRRQGQILSRAVLADQVWGMNFDSETNVVEVAVRRLRSKIDDPFEDKLLHTVRGMGYVMEHRGAAR